MKFSDVSRISPERRRIAQIFKTHIERAIDELGCRLFRDSSGKI